MDRWETYFKPETRSAGNALAAKGAVNVSRGSDTQVQCYIRGSSSCKVVFSSDSIDSEAFTATCNCSQGKKGLACKHMWAALTSLEEASSDFLEAKVALSTGAASGATSAPADKKPLSESQAAYQEKRAASEAAYKEKQSDYRKQQYQRQKDKLNAKKGKAPKVAFTETFPEDVEAALKYFEVNGFDLRTTLTSDDVSNARKILARIFHPDKGGSHDEIVELNTNADILLEFAELS